MSGGPLDGSFPSRMSLQKKMIGSMLGATGKTKASKKTF